MIKKISPTGLQPHTHQAKTAGRGLQPRPKRLFSGVGKYFGRGCKPRPADHGLIKTMSYDLSLMHMGCNPIRIRLRNFGGVLKLDLFRYLPN
ncbi:Uncharacterized protein dnm_076740 [Desulfonema magnum]|uniref:Uncharacterized protein n=1 Tax=Desulfonema magnum TaxID=45655 RepID=A0A975GS30_9BACT|nr:Uncharacterized protein dnm_076740 [Desulfonema magnum]